MDDVICPVVVGVDGLTGLGCLDNQTYPPKLVMMMVRFISTPSTAPLCQSVDVSSALGCLFLGYSSRSWTAMHLEVLGSVGCFGDRAPHESQQLLKFELLSSSRGI